ncbi:acyl-CoA dehydrogenase family protein [Aciditerrimonas ferrireducens]|uniref:Acyl-CoA dehydrogenase family protein n=1 Tax=Aciditerrimonas ferrireducens TaxID=667306 RepID=A0ABV6C0K0_9ACTN
MSVRLELPGDDDPRRQAIRAWLAAHPSPSGRELAEGGWVVPHWPRPYGHDADPVFQLIVDDELAKAGVRRPENPIGIGWAAPTILLAGTPEQRERYLLPALAGEEVWCQLFSEPDAGSDLASLRTRAVADGEGWVVSGRKIWTSGAQHAQFGILLARTDPDAPRHQGITYFICPMTSPGITVRPIVDMTGLALFNEVTLDEVHLGPELVVGRPGDGWRLAKLTLANERVSLSSGGVLWGRGPTVGDLVDQVRASGGVAGPARDRLVRAWADGQVLEQLRLRLLAARMAGQAPGPEASVQKLAADRHGQAVLRLAKDLEGPAGTVAEGDPVWQHGFLFSPALTIGGGTAEVQRNVIGERVLGLPRDPEA